MSSPEEKALKNWISAGIKAEIEAKEAYLYMASRVESFIVKDRFQFLAWEEDKHRKFLENFYREMFNDEPINLPEDTKIPKPKIEYGNNLKIADIIRNAMRYEEESEKYYMKISEMIENDNLKRVLRYFSSMERNHYNLLKTELESAERYEAFDDHWPMMHVGP